MNARKIKRKTFEILLLIFQGEFAVAFSTVFEWVFSDTVSVGLVRDLSIPHQGHPPKTAVHLRLVKNEDFNALFHSEKALGEDVRTLASFEGFLRQGIGITYVATTTGQIVCYFATLITEKYNVAQKDYFRGYLPQLKEGEALIENIYTVPKFRRLGIHGYATHLICEEAKKMGLQSVMIYIGCGGEGSLKGARHAGFRPFAFRMDRWRFFRRSVLFMSLDETQDFSKACRDALAYFKFDQT